MTDVIELARKTGLPETKFLMRWRILTTDMRQFIGAWTPNVDDGPNLGETLKIVKGKVDKAYVEGYNLKEKHCVQFLTIPGLAFADLSYKGMAALGNIGTTHVVGICATDVEGRKYEALRNGDVTIIEVEKKPNAANNN
jgi:hypothetical protein